MDERIPICVLTGFLGSGKTSLLNRLLQSPEAAESAVLINEFGEIGLDHLLLEKIDGETALLDSGCVCCTVRSDLLETVARLLARRRKGEIPPFRRIVLETTGLADPTPIAHVLMTEPHIAGHVRLDSVVCTIDALNVVETLAHHRQSRRQVAMADRLVLTKTDLASAEQACQAEAAVRRLNLSAPLLRAAESELPVASLLQGGSSAGVRVPEASDWLGMEGEGKAGWHRAQHGHDHDHEHDHDHGEGIETFHVILDQALSWAQLSEWIRTLNERRGSSLLRVKGLVDIEGQSGPVVVHGVQQIIHVPQVLPAWPSEDRRSRIVFILDGPPQNAVALKQDLDRIIHPNRPTQYEERRA